VVDRVYGGSQAQLTVSLNRSRWFDDLQLGLEGRRGTNEQPKGGGETELSGGASARASSSSLERGGVAPRCTIYDGVSTYASQQQDQLILLTFRWRQSMSSSCGDGFFDATLIGVEGVLRSTFGFKNWTGSLLMFTSCSKASLIAPTGGGKSSLVAT
jgi:hypothetical protein